MDCVNCGASLPPKSNICKHCGTLNDTDLRAIQRNTKRGPQTDRICPRCDEHLHTISLHVDGPLLIERCDKCLGIFFDPGELETLLDASVSKVSSIDYDRMNALVDDEGYDTVPAVTYVKCPACGRIMNRENFGRGARSGVIVDVCKNDGVWLDGGELSKLLKWTKAGGQLFADMRQEERTRKEERKRTRRRTGFEEFDFPPESENLYPHNPLTGILRFVARLLR